MYLNELARIKLNIMKAEEKWLHFSNLNSYLNLPFECITDDFKCTQREGSLIIT